MAESTSASTTPLTTYLLFVEQLKHQALRQAMAMAPVRGYEQAENDAVHLVGDGMALVSLEEAMQTPDRAANRYAQHRASSGMPLYDQEVQWALCPLSKREAFLRLVDVGATVRDSRRPGFGDRIRQDAATIEPDDLEGASTPLSAAIEFLEAWPDLGQISSPRWLVQAFRRRTN